MRAAASAAATSGAAGRRWASSTPAPTPGTVFGVATITPIDHNIAGEGLVQATSAVALLDGNVQIIGADTALTGGTNKLVCGVPGTIAPPCPALDAAGGVPFVYTDNTAKNNLTYYYTVTAFDANSIRSGPSSLESARVLAKVVPVGAELQRAVERFAPPLRASSAAT